MKLIVGLGNPGKEYENTRHNIGFMVLDKYFSGKSVTWKNKFEGTFAEISVNGEKVIFLKPLTYMNLSGNSIRKVVDFYKINTDDIFVIQDDLDMPYLSYKLKYKSSSGGHNGIKSIISCLGTDKISRLKIGISHDRKYDTKDYVLGKFSKTDLDEFNNKADVYCEIIDLFILKSIEDCMQKYNVK